MNGKDSYSLDGFEIHSRAEYLSSRDDWSGICRLFGKLITDRQFVMEFTL